GVFAGCFAFVLSLRMFQGWPGGRIPLTAVAFVILVVIPTICFIATKRKARPDIRLILAGYLWAWAYLLLLQVRFLGDGADWFGIGIFLILIPFAVNKPFRILRKIRKMDNIPREIDFSNAPPA